jgi:hypothetical protein
MTKNTDRTTKQTNSYKMFWICAADEHKQEMERVLINNWTEDIRTDDRAWNDHKKTMDKSQKSETSKLMNFDILEKNKQEWAPFLAQIDLAKAFNDKDKLRSL